MSNEMEVQAVYLIQAYQAELTDAIRTIVMLKAMIAQKDQQIAEALNGKHTD